MMVAGAFGIAVVRRSGSGSRPRSGSCWSPCSLRGVRRGHDRGREHDHAAADARRGPQPDERGLRGRRSRSGLAAGYIARGPGPGRRSRRRAPTGSARVAALIAAPWGCCRCGGWTSGRGPAAGADDDASSRTRREARGPGARSRRSRGRSWRSRRPSALEAEAARSTGAPEPPAPEPGASRSRFSPERPFRTRLPRHGPNRYDAIVIGGGHNGLVAAAYLAKKGARTVVLEARHKTGGAADTMSPWPEAPEFKVTTLSYVMSLMPDTILRDLELARHGYRSDPHRPVLRAVPRRAAHHPVRRRRPGELRRVRQVLEAGRRRDRAVGRVDRAASPTCSGRC